MEKVTDIDIAVVGGGAAGLVAAITAAENRKRVAIFESGTKLGRKILISGNGRCNITNLHADKMGHYHSRDSDFIQGILRQFNLEDTLSFFSDLGIELVEEKRGRLFPRSNQASSVVEVLYDKLRQLDVKVNFDCKITEIEKIGERFSLRGFETELFFAGNVVLACGGVSVEKVGGNSSGLEMASRLGHGVSTLHPGLVPLKSPLTYLKRMKGVKTVAVVRIRGGKGKEGMEDHDDLFFADYGVSGFTILNLSARIVPMLSNGIVQLQVNLFPGKTQRELYNMLQKRWSCNPHRTLNESFTGILNSKLVNVLVEELGYNGKKRVRDIDDEECKKISKSLSEWNIPVKEPRGFDYAEVMIGGVITDGINPQTLESYICPGLFFCGEMIDVHGDLGGYNFQWAWSSGKVAGSNVQL
ncbi:MAG: aminoacetone oxidase family FAD-binding enzyme [Candidatus Latescibacterota bacterium]|nr:aminoacetone oxidase family FAD-binding enzyme [Candidatus Latescibacterota bacterium]